MAGGEGKGGEGEEGGMLVLPASQGLRPNGVGVSGSLSVTYGSEGTLEEQGQPPLTLKMGSVPFSPQGKLK